MGNFTIKPITPKGGALKKKMGIPPRDLAHMRTEVIAKAAAKRAATPVKHIEANTNPQNEAMKKALQGVRKNQKTFGVPGAR